MRLIDENVLLGEIEKLPFINEKYDHEHANKSFINGIETFHVMVLNVLKRQPIIDPESLRQQWIPVNESLPECGEHYKSNDVLVSVDYRPDDPEETKDTFVSIDHVCFNCFEQGEFSIERDNPYDTEPSPYFVTHWMPLPEPYKGEHDD